MIAADCVAILLAAGRSERFGADDKLAQDYRGQPLAYHAADALAALPFKARLAVCSGASLDFAARGFGLVHNARPADGLSGSLRLGVATARATGCAAVLVALADMPCVTAAHFQRLLDAAGDATAIVASSDGAQSGPPAVIGAAHFDALLALEGDAGARTLIRGGRQVVAEAGLLLDIDRPEDLEQLRRL